MLCEMKTGHLKKTAEMIPLVCKIASKLAAKTRVLLNFFLSAFFEND